MRLATLNSEPLDTAQSLDVSYCGAEMVAAITLAQQGEKVAFAAKVSNNRLGDNALKTLTSYGVDPSCVIRSNERMGLFFLERGRSIRPNVVTYDRSNTAMAKASHEDFDWDHLLNGVELFFFSGVVPAISEEMELSCLEGLRACKGRGIHTVMDLNYRDTMWRSRDYAQHSIGMLLPYVDELIASEDDVLSFEGISVEKHNLFNYCLSWAHGMLADYSLERISTVVRDIDRYGVATIRGAMIDREQTYLSQSQQVLVADISSCGSVFAAAVVHGEHCGWEPDFIVDYAAMSSAYKATIYGDYSSATESEIAALLASGVKPSIRQ